MHPRRHPPSRDVRSPRQASAARPGGLHDRRGTITLICGCMFSGKTTELLRRIEGRPSGATAVFKHAIDTRYSPDAVVSHGGKACPANVVALANDLLAHIHDGTELVALDEAHFFDEKLVDIVEELRDRGVDVILTSLDMDSWGRPFAVIERLRAIADQLDAKSATCARCGRPADRTHRLTPIVDRCLVGGSESYEPRCVKCWHAPPEPPP